MTKEAIEKMARKFLRDNRARFDGMETALALVEFAIAIQKEVREECAKIAAQHDEICNYNDSMVTCDCGVVVAAAIRKGDES